MIQVSMNFWHERSLQSNWSLATRTSVFSTCGLMISEDARTSKFQPTPRLLHLDPMDVRAVCDPRWAALLRVGHVAVKNAVFAVPADGRVGLRPIAFRATRAGVC